MSVDDIWNLIISNFIGCLIVFFRMSGIFTFNPILSRANVPTQLKVMMSIVLSVFTLSAFGGNIGIIYTSIPELVLLLLKEALIGLVFGFMVNLILSSIILAGELVDNQVGFSIAKSMDPGTGIQMPVFANIWNYMFILYFFMADGHLAYIKLFFISYKIIPVDFSFSLNTISTIYAIVNFLGVTMLLACKLAMPYVSAQLIMEFAVGIVMKAVPTIQVFVVNIQLKIFLGLILAMALVLPSTEYINYLLDVMNRNLEGIMNGFL